MIGQDACRKQGLSTGGRRRAFPAAVKPHARAEASWPAPMKPTLMVRLRVCRAAPRNAQLPSERASGEGGELKDATCRVPRPESLTQRASGSFRAGPFDPSSLTDRARRALRGPAQTGRPVRGLELGSDQSASRSLGGPIVGWGLGPRARLLRTGLVADCGHGGRNIVCSLLAQFLISRRGATVVPWAPRRQAEAARRTG